MRTRRWQLTAHFRYAPGPLRGQRRSGRPWRHATEVDRGVFIAAPARRRPQSASARGPGTQGHGRINA